MIDTSVSLANSCGNQTYIFFVTDDLGCPAFFTFHPMSIEKLISDQALLRDCI